MGTFLSERELRELTAPDNTAFPAPVPLQMVSNGEFNPLPQTADQRKVEGRLKDLADQNGRKLGLDRRQFLRTTCGMAAAFIAMNEVFGPSSRSIRPRRKNPRQVLRRAASVVQAVHLRRSVAFRARRLSVRRHSWAGELRRRQLEPGDEERADRHGARPLQVRRIS